MPTMEGASYAVFAVELSEPAAASVAVEYYTEDDTALAGRDYQATSGAVLFEIGETAKTVQVLVYGRADDDTTEERSFNLRLRPTPDIILGSSFATECRITITEQESGAPLIGIVTATGPQGIRGLPGLSAYEVAVLAGFSGTVNQWLLSLGGNPVELVSDDTNIYWRVSGDPDWILLVPLAALKGAEVELQKSSTHIQWRYVGADTWTNLVPLTDITGPAGAAAILRSRGAWVTGSSYDPGDYVYSESSADAGENSLYFWLGTGTGVSSTAPKDDAANWDEVAVVQGPPGPAGEDGTVTFATLAQAQAATANDVASTPAKVREYLEQFGLTSTYTTASANLNTIVKGGFFTYDNGSINTPSAGTYGRGICIPSSAGYVTQLAIENSTRIASVRYFDGSTWGAWGPLISSASGQPLKAVLGADAGGTTTADWDVLQLPVVANTIYQLKVEMPYRVTDLANGIAVRFYGTDGAGFQTLTVRGQSDATDGTIVSKQAKGNAGNMSFPEAKYLDDNLLTITGLVYPTSSGNLKLKMNSMTASQYCAAQKGTTFILEPVGTVS